RPAEISEFMRLGRKWWQPPTLKNVGRVGEAGSFADIWWKWWKSLQPPERESFGGMLTTPTELTLGSLTKMHGRTGFMLAVASLLWWGLVESRVGELGNKSGWSAAVIEVTWLLDRLV
ncbi:hypothetical protein C8R44DRAFT_564926, partial [Mycena epipterygia]